MYSSRGFREWEIGDIDVNTGGISFRMPDGEAWPASNGQVYDTWEQHGGQWMAW